MAPESCPLLGTLDEHNRPGQPIEYPSFENRCLTSDDRDTLLLADQATYCLSGSFRMCPRYRVAQALANGVKVDPKLAAELAGGVLASDQLRPEVMATPLIDERDGRRRWAWLGASVMFITLLLCGSMFAAWSGWSQVQAFLDQRQAGVVQSVSAAPLAPQYVVMTVTAVAPTATSTQVQPAQDPAAAQRFPVAVTATPQGIPGSMPVQGVPEAPPLIVVDPGAVAAPSGAPIAVAPPMSAEVTPPNILIEVPTRRPTPVFDIPTSTPVVETPTSTPSNTPSPTPMGTPIIVFGPAQQLLREGECTMVSWNVQNVREVYYENIGVDGRGQREECVDDVLEIFHLIVVLQDGSAKTYTTTVTMMQPTSTPEPTETFTPVPVFTPTWTPQPPTPTPTPDVTWGVVVNVDGSTDRTCAPGTTCEIGLVVTNTGDQLDNLLVSIRTMGPWSAMLCRLDGVCAQLNLVLTSVGPGNSAIVNLRINLPGDATGSASYGVEAASSGSNGATTSGVVNVNVSAQ